MSNPGIEAARTLTRLGYRFTVNGDTIKAKYEGTGEPNPGQVRALLAQVREHKPEVLAYLSRPALRDRILTCVDCPHFEANHGPNPREAWGFCKKMNRGRYGCATGCEALIDTGTGRSETDG